MTTPEQALALYERMLLIRRMEEKLSADAAAGILPGAVHLYIGQEAVATGVCMQLKDSDWITSTHRGHGHFLAKGGDPKAMMAEIWGKQTGICKGMGGSMHVADVTKGILGANGIVGGGFAIATGAAFGSMLSKDGRATICFFGDGASNQGVFVECLNVSSLWKLLIVFVCEHNRLLGVHARGAGYFGRDCRSSAGFSACTFRWSMATTSRLCGTRRLRRSRACAGAKGPATSEAETYRIRGHMEFEKELLAGGRKYRELEEIEQWKKKDPIDRYAAKLQQLGVATGTQLEEIEKRVAQTVVDADGSRTTANRRTKNWCSI